MTNKEIATLGRKINDYFSDDIIEIKEMIEHRFERIIEVHQNKKDDDYLNYYFMNLEPLTVLYYTENYIELLAENAEFEKYDEDEIYDYLSDYFTKITEEIMDSVKAKEEEEKDEEFIIFIENFVKLSIDDRIDKYREILFDTNHEFYNRTTDILECIE